MNEEGRNSKLVIGFILVIIGAVLLVWIALSRSANAPSQESKNESTQSTSSSPASNTGSDQTVSNNTDLAATITFTDNGFQPESLTVKTGATVTVKNNSSTEVQFSSDDHPSHLKEPELNLRALRPGESAMFIVTKTGKWGFHDHIHDNFTGTLNVTK